MKRTLFILLISMSMSTYAQFKTSDFNTALELINGSSQQEALSNLEILEKKYPKEAQVIFLRGFYQFRDGDQNGAMMNAEMASSIGNYMSNIHHYILIPC